MTTRSTTGSGVTRRGWTMALLACALAATPAGAQEAREMHAANPLDATFVYSDVARFWEAFDRLPSREPGENPFEAYLREGSAGLQAFIPDRRIVGPGELLDLVLSEMDYYEKVRPSTLAAAEYEAQIRAAYAAMKYWYPPATFPPTYYVVGRTTSGGTYSSDGMIIGIETFSDMPLRTTYGRPSADLDDLPFIVAHELVHFHQVSPPEGASLLHLALIEGAADFVGELIAGGPVKDLNGPGVYPYGEAHEAELWAEFSERMHDPDVEGWLYSAAPEGRPQNLGYWMGYQIVEAFFERARDEHRAIAEILGMRDPVDFLRASGYPDGPR